MSGSRPSTSTSPESRSDATDTGQITFECQLYNTVTPPTAWQACQSGQPFSGLGDTTSTPYTFRVRAVDATDAAVICPVVLCLEDEPDYDPTPATTTIKVDTKVPNTFITRTPQDDIRPDWPVTLTRSPQVSLNSNEGTAGFACTLNDKPRACGQGLVTLKDLKSGPQDFTAKAVDAAGNADPTPSSTKFFVPSEPQGVARFGLAEGPQEWCVRRRPGAGQQGRRHAADRRAAQRA